MVRARASETAGTGTDQHLWAKAAELERDFAGYKRRLAESRKPSSSHHHAASAAEELVAARGVVGGEGEKEEEEDERFGGDDSAAAAGGSRGRRYEEYVRRRDERLRHEWRARMQRKEAEVQALWARLDRTGSGSSRGGGRRGGGGDDRDGELQFGAAATTTSHGACREDQVKPQQKPGNNLVVKLKPPTPATPRGHPPPAPATAKLARPRTSVPSSLAAAAGSSPSARLSTPDPRRRPSSHLHREQQQPPATPRKAENRLPPPSAAAAATPRPRTTTTTTTAAMLSRSRSMFSKDRAAVGESPRPPPRFQPPRSSYDGASRQQPAPAPSPLADAIAAVQSQIISCPPRQQPAAVAVADRKKASAAVAPEPFLVRRPGNGVEPASSSPPPVVVAKKDLLPYSYSGEIAPAAGCENADKKSNQQEFADQSSDNKPAGSEEMTITGDSDTEPSYVYIKKDSDEQIPRPAQPAADNKECKYSDGSVEEDNMESTGSNEVTPAGDADADEEEEFRRRESSESLYSNVQSSFSQRSELDTSPESSNASAWTTRKSTEVEADAERRRVPTPTTPRSSVSVQSSPMDAVNGLKRLLTFAKRNGKASSEAAAAAAERATLPAPPAGDDGSVINSRDCPAGGSANLAVDSSDDLDSSYVISPHAHVRSLQSSGPSYPASSEQKEPALHAKSPRVHRSFFSFSSFKSKAN